MEELATRFLVEAFAATKERSVERILLRFLAFAEGIRAYAFDGYFPSISRRSRFARGALEPVFMLVGPVARPEAPAAERLLTLLAHATRLGCGKPVLECQTVKVRLSLH